MRTETQVGNGDRTRFFGIVDKVTLCVVVGLLTDNFDRVFVRADGAIRAKPPEHTLYGVLALNRECRIVGKAGVSNVVVDPGRAAPLCYLALSHDPARLSYSL